MNRSTPGLPVHHQLPGFTQTHVHQVGDAIQPSYPLLSPSPPDPIPPSIRVFSSESTLCMRWPKYWSFSFSISPSNEHAGLISFKMDWLDLQKHQFFGPQLSSQSNSHIPTWLLEKTIAVIRQTFVSKVISLLFNMLSRLAIAFLLRGKLLLISWLQSLSTVILETKKIKSLLPLFPLLFSMKWWDQMLCFSSLNVEF